jgi:hypothetical protein
MKLKIEDTFIGLLFLLAASGLTGCYRYSTNFGLQGKTTFGDESERGLTPSSNKDSVVPRSYEFTGVKENGEACTTLERRFENLNEYCLGLQQEDWNGGCAQKERQERFARDCAPMKWDQAAASKEWEAIQEDKFTCFTGHKGQNDLAVQGTASPRIVLSHSDYVAIAKKKENPTQFATHMELSLEIQDRGGNVIVRKDGSWKLDSLGDGEPIQLYSQNKNAMFICLPGLLTQLPPGRLPK